jgi:LemA protein
MGKTGIIILAVLILLGLICAGWYISGVNKVVTLDEEVTEGWAQIEAQLQRRHDLIPNLVNTVKGYASHEKDLFTEVTRLRSQWGAAKTKGEKIGAARGLEGAISRLLLVAENYPDLKASENFLALQSQLEGTENRIAVARTRYNRGVKVFNAYIRTVFGSFFAKRRNLTEPAPYFEAEETATEVPEVKF